MERFKRYRQISLIDFPDSKKYLALTIGITTAIGFYLGTQYLFVLIRNFQLAFQYNINYDLSNSIISRISFLFAGNAVILGNLVAFGFLFSVRSKHFFEINNASARRRVLNDQAFLSGNYFYWALKILSTVGVFQFFSYYQEIFDDLWIVGVYLLLVLFFDQTKSIRRFVKGYRFKQYLTHFLFTIILSFIIAQINKPLYYQSILKNSNTSFFVHIPELGFGDQQYLQRKQFDFCDSRLKMIKESNGTNVIIGDKKVAVKLIGPILMEEFSSLRDAPRPEIFVYGDSELKMKDIQNLEFQLIQYNYTDFVYVYTALNKRYGSHQIVGAEKRLFISEALLDSIKYSIPPPTLFPYDEIRSHLSSKNVIEADISEIFRKHNGNTSKLLHYFKSQINETVVFNFIYNNIDSYNEYLTVFASYRQAVLELRNKGKTIEEYPQNYFELDQKEKKLHQTSWEKEQVSLKLRYPMIYFDNFHF